MATYCRDLRYESLAGDGGCWKGTLTPLCSTEQLLELFDDIHHNRPIYGVAGGAVRHLASCTVQHCHHDWMDGVRERELLRSFTVTIRYSGGRDDPRCWVDGINLQNGRHMWTDNSICPFLSSTATWDWRQDTVADFMGHVSTWLISWMVFQQTGVWIAGEHGNTPAYHLENIKPHHLCWCRSGRKYRKCHMQEDHLSAVSQIGRK
jgi:hypothetical protein